MLRLEKPPKVDLWKRKLRKGGFSWVVDVRIGSKRLHRQSIGIKTTANVGTPEFRKQEAYARRMAAQMEERYLRIHLGLELTVTVSKQFSEVAEEYVKSYTGKNLNRIAASVRLASECFSAMDEVSRKDIMKFQERLVKAYAGETAKNYWGVILRIFRLAVDSEYLDKSPFEGILLRLPKEKQTGVKKSEKWLRLQEVEKLLKTPSNGQIRQVFPLMCCTGMGLAEVRSLKWSELVDEGPHWRLQKERSKVKGAMLSASFPKGLLMEAKNESDFVFNNLVSDTALRKHLRKWASNAGLDCSDKISLYWGRHTFASNLLQSGADVVTVSRLMAHATTKTTLEYLGQDEDAMREASITLSTKLIFPTHPQF
jgi:integrase/recombinase XerD